MVSYLRIPWQILHFHSWCQRRRGQLISVPEKASCGGKKSEHSSELHWSRSVYPVSCDNIHLSTYNLRSWGRRMASWRPGWATEWGPVFKNKQNCFGLIWSYSVLVSSTEAMEFIILESCWEHPSSLPNLSMGSQNHQVIRSGTAKSAFFVLNTSL